MASKRKSTKRGDQGGAVSAADLLATARRTLHVLKTYTLPVAGGRRVMDPGAKVVIAKALRAHNNLFGKCLLQLVTSGAQQPDRVNEDVTIWPGAKLGEAEGEIPPSLWSAVHQAASVGGPYELGQVIPTEAIEALQVAVAILEDLSLEKPGDVPLVAKTDLPPLTEDARRVLALLLGLPKAEAVLGKQIAQKLKVPEERIRNSIRSELLPHGLQNRPGEGYYIQASHREAAGEFLGLEEPG